MATNSPIEWTDATWNPVTGCSKISPGCKHCYAEKLASRLKAMGQANYRNGFELTLQPQMLDLPLRWKTPKRIFVNSMSDLFHVDVPHSYIKDVFDVMRRAHWHQFQVLTKRAERIEELSPKLKWEPNIWMGVSVENDKYAYRIDHLRETRAHVKFLSIEFLEADRSTMSHQRMGVKVGGYVAYSRPNLLPGSNGRPRGFSLGVSRRHRRSASFRFNLAKALTCSYKIGPPICVSWPKF
jgi:protein gp37